ncbi:MAG: HAD-IIA family hydrolase [Acidimicrobiales bacterium]
MPPHGLYWHDDFSGVCCLGATEARRGGGPTRRCPIGRIRSGSIDPVSGFVFDLDGVLWHGTDPIMSACEAVSRLIEAEHRVLFATNNSAATVATQEAKLGRFGIDASGRVLSSAMAAASLVEPGERVFVLGGAGIEEAVLARGASCVPVADPDAGLPVLDAVIVGLDFDLNYDRLRMAVTAVRNGARFIGTNHDPTYPTEHGLWAGGGSIVAAVATSAEIAPVVAGKPHQPMADLAVARIGPDALMVGDRNDTDGDFARSAGFRFAMVLSGVTSLAEAEMLEPAPDLIADDAAAVVASVVGL